MRTIIIEDEKPAARLLQRQLDRMQVKVDALLHSVREAVAYFQQNEHPDLIFLDIQLSDGLSFEIFEQVDIKCPVIFTTAYDEYALRAFKLNSIDYLLKPIDESDLETAISKYKFRTNGDINGAMDFAMMQRLFAAAEKPSYKTRFSMKVGEHIKVINIEEIELFYSQDKGTYLVTNEGRSLLIDSPLDVIEKELDPKKYFRVSRKYIVALAAIKDIVVYSNSRLKLTMKSYHKDEIIVSRERVGEFKEWLG